MVSGFRRALKALRIGRAPVRWASGASQRFRTYGRPSLHRGFPDRTKISVLRTGIDARRQTRTSSHDRKHRNPPSFRRRISDRYPIRTCADPHEPTMRPTQALSVGKYRHLKLTTKDVGRGFYKGNRTGSMGRHTKYGGYIIEWEKVRTFAVPENLKDFKVRCL